MRLTACKIALLALLPLAMLADWRQDMDDVCWTPPVDAAGGVTIAQLQSNLIFYAGFNGTTVEQFGHTVGGSTCGWTNDAIAGGQSAWFDASTRKYIYYTTPQNYVFTTNFAFSFWFKDRSTGTPDQYPIGVTRTTIPYGQWNIYYQGSTTQTHASAFLAGSGGQDFARGKSNLTKHVWHHVVCNYKMNATSWQYHEIYNDGVLIGTNATYTGSAATTAMNLNFGARGVDWAAPFNGFIDETAIWSNRNLTASEVSALYNSGTGLALY